MAPLIDRVKYFFSKQILPHSAFLLSSRYLCGIQISPVEKNGKIKHHIILPLEQKVIQPSFFQKNIMNVVALREKIEEGKDRLRLKDQRVAFILPELSQKSFILSFDSFPSSRKEREDIIRFRIKRLMPLLPDDTRISYDLISSTSKGKIIATIARASVIREYEDFFSQFKLKVNVVSAPFLNLLNLLKKEKERDLMLINIEEDAFSLAAVINSEITLYRQKPLAIDFQDHKSLIQELGNIKQEIENTTNFVEDREKRRIASFWIRLGLLDSEEEIFSLLDGGVPFPFNRIESSLEFRLSLREKRILSPLIGQLL